MKKLGLLMIGLLFSISTWADLDLGPLLNKVTLPLQAEQWLTTKSALVNVSVNASVTDQGIENLQSAVIAKLNQIAKGEWHVLSFTRQQDQSGLESIQIIAQARLAQFDLGGLRDKAKSLTKPGEKFNVDSVQFTPSEDEIRQANTILRNNLYQQAKAEIDTLNKTYPDQKYYLYSIDFLNTAPPAPVPMQSSAMYMEKTSRPVAPPMSVGNKLQLQATVIIAALPDVVLQKINHP